MVTISGAPPAQRRSAPRRVRTAVRPPALTTATALSMIAVLPFLVIGVATAGLAPERRLSSIGQWPRVHADPAGYRLLGVGLLLCALGYLWLAVLVGLRRRWARTALATAVALADPALVMVLLADTPPRPGWLAVGGVVVLSSLAGLVHAYQPRVDRYLIPHGRRAR